MKTTSNIVGTVFCLVVEISCIVVQRETRVSKVLLMFNGTGVLTSAAGFLQKKKSNFLFCLSNGIGRAYIMFIYAVGPPGY